MNKTTLIIVTIVAGIALFAGGFFFSQVNAQTIQSDWMWGNGDTPMNPDMMGSGQYGSGMMNGGMGGSYRGMMVGYDNAEDAEPLTIEAAETAVHEYLTTLDQDNLAIGEIMIFTNHAYVQIIDSNTGQGAFELLVDPITGNVYPEPGPNMMWNTAYGAAMHDSMHESGSAMMGGMMGYSSMMGNGQFGSSMMDESQYGTMMGGWNSSVDTPVNITTEEAVTLAQAYLDTYISGATADEMPDSFPGYYTLHVLENGEISGMLSVNAYTGQVFFHHWHGEFVTMTGDNHD